MTIIDVLLCEGGTVRSGTASFPCTGSAHLSNGQEVRCTDPSHKVPGWNLTLAANLTIGSVVIGPVATGDLTGQRWTCS